MASGQHYYDMHDWLSLHRPYYVQLLSSVIMYGVLVRRMGVHDFNYRTDTNHILTLSQSIFFKFFWLRILK